MLSSSDQEASIKLIVEEIWNVYDKDQSGKLSKYETMLFVMDNIPGFDEDRIYNDDAFEDIFKDFDLNGSGTVERHEMVSFIKRIMCENETLKENEFK